MGGIYSASHLQETCWALLVNTTVIDTAFVLHVRDIF